MMSAMLKATYPGSRVPLNLLQNPKTCTPKFPLFPESQRSPHSQVSSHEATAVPRAAPL